MSRNREDESVDLPVTIEAIIEIFDRVAERVSKKSRLMMIRQLVENSGEGEMKAIRELVNDPSYE